MIRWMRVFNRMLKENSLKTFLNIVYVDDQLWAGEVLKLGVRWDKEIKKMRWDR